MAVSPVSFQDSNISMEEALREEDLNVTDIKPNTIVRGKVVTVQTETRPEQVIVAMGAKSEGKIALREFQEKPHVGDDIEALVKAIDRDTGLAILSKRALEQQRGWEIAQEAFENGVPVYGVVKRPWRQGYLVMVDGLSMFLPHSHVGIVHGSGRRGKKPDIIGLESSFKILELNPRRKTGVISRKAFLDEQNEKSWEELTDVVKIGDIVKGKVVNHIKKGVFIDVAGVQGFLHISNISWERRTDNVEEKLPVDQEVQVRVLEIDPENHRLSLGLKQLTSDPWDSVSDKYEVGQVVEGKVSFSARYGAFVELEAGLEGLLHVSEMSWTRKVNHAQEILKVGETVETQIIAINVEDKRISLGLKQLQENPWDHIQRSVKVGDIRKGIVQDVTNFGVFVKIADEIDGLVRKEDLNWDEPAPEPSKLHKKGDEVEFKITEINLEEQKIGCSIRHLLPNPYKKLKNDFPRGTVVDGVVTGVVDFGVFVRIADGYEGLVHISAMGKEEAASPKKAYSKGDSVKVVVKNIDPDNRKISLSIRDVESALERIEIQQYLNKENDVSRPVANPFANLRDKVKK